MAANRQVARLGIDVDAPVDVFGAIEDDQIWLRFDELENLYGFFQRAGDVAGIALHSGHPTSLQRFTAAHEYGHFVLGHSFSQDGDAELYANGGLPLKEIQAQAFAAEFLMPLALVNRALDRLSLPETPDRLDSREAYQLSLEIGASYQATVARLDQLNKITRERASALRGQAPMKLKVELGAGTKPRNSRAAVWAITDGYRDRQPRMSIEDELHVRLGEVPSSGYRWSAPETNHLGLELVADELEVTEGAERIGGSLCRHLWWRAVAPGAGPLDLHLNREWDEGATVDAVSIPITIDVRRNATETGTGVAGPQREGLLAAA